MTTWHYLGLLLLGAIGTWVGVIRCLTLRRWKWAFLGLVPIGVWLVWFFWVWPQSNWDVGFFDQPAGVLISEFVLLAVLWAGAVVAGFGARHRAGPRTAKAASDLSSRR